MIRSNVACAAGESSMGGCLVVVVGCDIVKGLVGREGREGKKERGKMKRKRETEEDRRGRL